MNTEPRHVSCHCLKVFLKSNQVLKTKIDQLKISFQSKSELSDQFDIIDDTY